MPNILANSQNQQSLILGQRSQTEIPEYNHLLRNSYEHNVDNKLTLTASRKRIAVIDQLSQKFDTFRSFDNTSSAGSHNKNSYIELPKTLQND